MTGLLAGIHHVGLRVVDVDDATERWSHQFGLTLSERTQDRAYLRCAFEDYSLELIESGSPGFDHAGWQLAPGASAADLGFEGELVDPDGHGVELVPWREPESDFPDLARLTTELPGFRPRKLGHINVVTDDVRRLSSFYVDRLGFRVTDYLGDEGIWLHLNADHHVHAMVQKDVAHFHHFALELADFAEMRVALDHLAQNGRWVVWGPGRHGVAASLFAYIRIPEEELIVELYADMEQLRPGHKPRRWEDNPHSSNIWGTLPPRTYFRFDPEAIETERGQLAALGRIVD